jgi:hypothetical protein
VTDSPRLSCGEFFFFFYIFPSKFCKNTWSEKKLQNYIFSVVRDGGRDLSPATAVGHGGRDPVCFQKFVIFLFELEWR